MFNPILNNKKAKGNFSFLSLILLWLITLSPDFMNNSTISILSNFFSWKKETKFKTMVLILSQSLESNAFLSWIYKSPEVKSFFV